MSSVKKNASLPSSSSALVQRLATHSPLMVSLSRTAAATFLRQGSPLDGTVSVNGTRVADEPAALLFETAAIEVPDANCRPAELGHNLRKVPITTSSTRAVNRNRRYSMKSATVVPIDRSAGRNFPIAGMYSFHSSGEYCCDGPLCHS
jgi:hypothetical protein